jgi:hypothetical protein
VGGGTRHKGYLWNEVGAQHGEGGTHETMHQGVAMHGSQTRLLQCPACARPPGSAAQVWHIRRRAGRAASLRDVVAATQHLAELGAWGQEQCSRSCGESESCHSFVSGSQHKASRLGAAQQSCRAVFLKLLCSQASACQPQGPHFPVCPLPPQAVQAGAHPRG